MNAKNRVLADVFGVRLSADQARRKEAEVNLEES
jgi:hypothetical protein